MWQLIQDNFISHYHEYIGDLHHMLVAVDSSSRYLSPCTQALLDILIPQSYPDMCVDTFVSTAAEHKY